MSPFNQVSSLAADFSDPARFRMRWLRNAIAAGLTIGLFASPQTGRAQPPPTTTYQSFSDTSAVPDESAARAALDSLRYQIVSDPELATEPAASSPANIGGSQLPPALVEQNAGCP